MVAILLSTFNGEKYLEQQILSIQNQTFEDWKLFVCDDGSGDKTNEIVNNISIIDPRIIILQKESTNMGAYKSFMWLLSQISAELYFFCDQDDIWLPSKIEKYLSIANKYPINEPLLIHSDLIIVDETLNVLHNSFWEFNGSKQSEFNSFNFHCAYNNIPGCAMLINKRARDLSLIYPNTAKMHDAWVSLIVSFYKGNIISIIEPLILYRQHSNNTIGAKRTRSITQKIYNINSILIENVNLYKTINTFTRISWVKFIFNKVKMYIDLTKH